MATQPNTITLYHGTSGVYDGPPTRGDKDVLRTGYVSLTANRDFAEEFAGGSRNSRVYAIAVPREKIAGLRAEGERLGKAGKWDELGKLIRRAGSEGYTAVAIPDISMGSAAPEFRLVGQVPANAWSVKPSEDAAELYGRIDAAVARIRAGEAVAADERKELVEILEETIEVNGDTADVLDEQGKASAARALRANVAQDQAALEVLGGDDGNESVGEGTSPPASVDSAPIARASGNEAASEPSGVAKYAGLVGRLTKLPFGKGRVGSKRRAPNAGMRAGGAGTPNVTIRRR